MHRKLLVIIILSSFTLTNYSQKIGYLGKKNIFNVGTGLMPVVELIITGEGNFLNPNFKFQGGYERIISNKTSISLNFQLINQYLTLRSSTQHYIFPGNLETKSIVYGNNLFASIKHFGLDKNGSIAPVGRYVTAGMGYSSYNVTDNGRYYPSGRKLLGNSKSGIIFFGGGKQTVLWNFINLDVSVDFGIHFNGLTKFFLKKIDSYGMDEVTRKSNLLVFSNYLFNLTIKTGFLL